MKKLIRLVVMMGLAMSGLASHADEVLYWMVDNPTITDLYFESYTASEAGAHGKTIDYARVAAFKTADLADYTSFDADKRASVDVIYLDLYYQEGEPPAWTVDHTLVPANDTAYVSGGKTAGDDTGAAHAYASLETLGNVDRSLLSFAIELGTWDPDASDPDAKWVLAAISETATYDQLHGYIDSQVGIQTQLAWTGGAYAAPEPTSGLLMVIGFAFLGLKRKKVVGCQNRGRDVLVASKEMKTSLI